MIKYNDEKRNAIFDHINLVVEDIKTFVKSSKIEIRFIKDILTNFEKLNLNYIQNLNDLIKNLEKRKKEEILIEKKNDIKKSYKSILHFTFDNFQEKFLNFREDFKKISDIHKEDFFSNISHFEENFLDHLEKKNREFESQVNCYKIEENEYLKNRKKFLDSVDKQKLSKVMYYINFKNIKTKELKKVKKKEWNYFKKFNYQNKLLNLVVINIKSLIENYEQIIRSKFSLIYFKLINPQNNLKNEKIKKYEDLITKYNLKFRNLRITTYLNNLSELKEQYFPLNKIVHYKSKLTLKCIQDIIKKIKYIHKNIKSISIFSKIDFFIHILIFDMKVIKKIKIVESDLDNLCKLDHMRILFLNLLLFLEYEDSFLFISDNSFDIIKNLILIFLNNLNINESHKYVDVIDILFEIGTKIYTLNINRSKMLDLSLIDFSLLSSFKNTFLLNNQNIWKNYYNFLLKELKKTSLCSKSKVINVVEKIYFYHFYLSQDEEVTCEFIKKILTKNNINSINFNSIKKSVMLKIGKYLYRFNKEIKKPLKIVKNQTSKIFQVLKILITKKSNFIDSEMLEKILSLNHEIHQNIILILIEKELYKIPLNSKNRKNLWISYINYFPYSSYKRNNEKKKEIDKQMLKQIKIDVKRTKQENKKKLEKIILEFFEDCDESLEYFQGFNYITSFICDNFNDEKTLFKILDYMSKYIFNDYFTSKFALKLNQINFQINNLIEYYYPDLSVHWKNNDINSEILFSSFLVSFFTSILNEPEYICLFWDIIIPEKWMGVVKCILFIVDMFYNKLISFNCENTLSFFSNLKFNNVLGKKMKKYDFKKFVQNFIFDKKRFFDLEIKFNSINNNISQF